MLQKIGESGVVADQSRKFRPNSGSPAGPTDIVTFSLAKLTAAQPGPGCEMNFCPHFPPLRLVATGRLPESGDNNYANSPSLVTNRVHRCLTRSVASLVEQLLWLDDARKVTWAEAVRHDLPSVFKELLSESAQAGISPVASP